jgi:hypothetical protein
LSLDEFMFGGVQLVLGCVEQCCFFALGGNLEPPPPVQHTHMHTAAATTTTAAADHQYATMAARTGPPTLARIGCRSAHDRRCMYSR